MRKILAIFILLLIPLCAHAEDLYVSQNSVGGDTGADCANAHSMTWFNTAGSWGAGAGKISAGDTVHFCGTISTQALVYGSGTAGNPITLKFETGAKFSAATWSTSSAIYAQSKDYLVIDGGTNGVIECTDNGDALATQDASQGVYIKAGTSIEVKNLTIQNIYVHTSGTVSAPTGSVGIYFVDCNTALAHNNTINNTYIGIFYTCAYVASISGFQAYSNTISSCAWGGGVALGNDGCSIDNVSIHDNDITMGTNWYDTADWNHLNGWHFYGRANDTDAVTNITIYNEYIHGDPSSHGTAFIYLEDNMISPLIYNCLLVNTVQGPQDGLIYYNSRPDTAASTPKIYNNTLVGVSTLTTGKYGMYFAIKTTGSNSNITPDVKNNILTNLYIGLWFNGTFGTITSDYNLIYSVGAYGRLTSTYYYNWTGAASWVTTAGYDAHSYNTDPLFMSSSDFTLQVTSPAKDTGADLSGTFTKDKNGTTRPQGAVWDIGAYEYVFPATTFAPWIH